MADLSTVARPYARAIFDLAREAGDLAGWSAGLAAAASVAEDPSARAFLRRPELGAAQRAEFMQQICASLDGAAVLGSDRGRNLLRLLAENDRLEALGEIAAQFDGLKAEHENKVKVTLVSAAAVDPAQAEKIGRALGARLGREVELEVEVDESLIGGAVVRAQDMVIDDSLETRLKRLASSLVD